MLTIYIDADACPVKAEIYQVARRYAMRVVVVANARLRVPSDPLVELVVCPGFGAADDWIAEQAGTGDGVVKADIHLAARCLLKSAIVLDPALAIFSENDIGAALASRVMDQLRQSGPITGSPMMAARIGRFFQAR